MLRVFVSHNCNVNLLCVFCLCSQMVVGLSANPEQLTSSNINEVLGMIRLILLLFLTVIDNLWMY